MDAASACINASLNKSRFEALPTNPMFIKHYGGKLMQMLPLQAFNHVSEMLCMSDTNSDSTKTTLLSIYGQVQDFII